MEPQEFYRSVDNVSLHFGEYPDLTDDEKWLVTLSGVFSSLAGDNVNTIATGRENGEVREALRRSWLISDRPTFEQAVVRLATSEKRNLHLKRLNMIKKFDETLSSSNIVCKFISKISFRFAVDWYKTKTKEDLRKVSKELDFDRIKNANIKGSGLYDMLAKAGKWTKELQKLGDYRTVDNLIGWDAVSLVNIVRCATQVGYIERDEFIKYAGPIRKQVQAAYNSWDELVLAYVVGSFVWRYSDDRAPGIIRTARQFLTDKRSPVHKIKFK